MCTVHQFNVLDYGKRILTEWIIEVTDEHESLSTSYD